jgi:hypothetical protein
MMKVALGCLAAALGVSSVNANTNTTSGSSRIYVHIPFQIHNPFGFEHVQAEFGFQQQHSRAGDIAEYLYWIDDELCSPLMWNKTRGYPAHTDGYHTPFILMANDGSCSSVTKARHAQQVGASALVIAKSECYCRDKGCVDKYPNDRSCLDHEPALVNDGSAQDISIPSFMIFKDLAETLKDQLFSKNQAVLMELVWGIHPQEGVHTDTDSIPLEYHLWTTAYDPLVDLETYSNLKTVADALQGKARFSPRYRLMDGSRFGCGDNNEEGPCDHLCTNHGRYCATHARDLSGHAIVKETLRRLCIWKHAEEVDQTQVWWDYILYHKEHCGKDPFQFASENCIHDAMKASKADASIIDQCMTDSGDVETNLPNSLLDHQLQSQKTSGVVSIPAMTINDRVLEHTSTWSLFESVCREYWLSPVPAPETCLTCATCPNVIGCLQEGHCVAFSDQHKKTHKGSAGGGGSNSNNKKKKNHWAKVFWLFVFCLIGYVAYRRYQQMQQYAGGERPSLNEYFALNSGE